MMFWWGPGCRWDENSDTELTKFDKFILIVIIIIWVVVLPYLMSKGALTP